MECQGNNLYISSKDWIPSLPMKVLTLSRFLDPIHPGFSTIFSLPVCSDAARQIPPEGVWYREPPSTPFLPSPIDFGECTILLNQGEHGHTSYPLAAARLRYRSASCESPPRNHGSSSNSIPFICNAGAWSL